MADNIECYTTKLTSLFECCQFCFCLDTFLVTEQYVCLLSVVYFRTVIPIVFEDLEKFTVQAFSYGFPRLGINCIIWDVCVSLKYACNV